MAETIIPRRGFPVWESRSRLPQEYQEVLYLSNLPVWNDSRRPLGENYIPLDFHYDGYITEVDFEILNSGQTYNVVFGAEYNISSGGQRNTPFFGEIMENGNMVFAVLMGILQKHIVLIQDILFTLML